MGQEKIRVKEAILVEGRYDKQRLETVVDGLVLETDGFRIFRDREKRELIRQLARRRGIIILTDSDRAGFQIRGHIKNIVGGQGRVYNAYIPDILGKERRKAKPSKEGKLGVEGMEPGLLRDILDGLGLDRAEEAPGREPITKLHFLQDGLTGGEGARERRKLLCRAFSLPEHLSANWLLEILNALTDYAGYRAALEKMGQG